MAGSERLTFLVDRDICNVTQLQSVGRVLS